MQKHVVGMGVLHFVEGEFAKNSMVWVESKFLDAPYFYIVVSMFILLGFTVMEVFLSKGAALCGLLQLWHQQLVKPRLKSMCKETSHLSVMSAPTERATIFSNTTETQACSIPFSDCSCTHRLRWLVADSFWIIPCFLTDPIFQQTQKWLFIINDATRRELYSLLKKNTTFCSHYLALESRELIGSYPFASSISINTHSGPCALIER